MIRGIRIAAIARALLGAPLGVLLAASSAGAAVTQADTTPLPQPTPSTEISLVTSRGFSADADTLVGLFKYFAGGADAAIDPINDAATTPGIFPAECGFKVQIVLKGGGLQECLRLVQRDHPLHHAVGDLPGRSRRTHGGTAQRDWLSGRRLLPTRQPDDEPGSATCLD